jgi:two-component system NarL family sensor kinase
MPNMRLPTGLSRGAPGGSVSVARAVAVFAITGAVTLMVLVASLAYLLSRAGHDEAIRDAQTITAAYGNAAVRPALDDRILSFDPATSAAFASTMRERLASSNFVRVKVWGPDGTIVYSDEPRLIGENFPFDDEAAQVMATGSTLAEVSDTTKPENHFENTTQPLLEVYQRLQTPQGTEVLFEAYLPYDSVQAEGRELWMSFAPFVILGLALMWLLQLPMAWSMGRQLQAGQEQRERLLQRALDVSDTERRTLAADLHNGVVQTLAGMAFTLGALEQHLPPDSSPETRAQVSEASEAARAAIRELRSMLVNLYPPTLRSSGLEPALNDLGAHLQARGIAVEVIADLPDRPSAQAEALLYRCAQEALRNVVKHAAAHEVRIHVSGDENAWRLTVIDDGAGFARPASSAQAGNLPGERMGLRLLAEMLEDADGSLRVEPGLDGGTVFTVEVPGRVVDPVPA